MKKSDKERRFTCKAVCLFIVLLSSAALSLTCPTMALEVAIYGKVVDEQGHGMRDVQIKVYSAEEGYEAYVKSATTTSSDGSFAMDLTVGKTYILSFMKDGYVKVTKNIPVRIYGTGSINIGDIVLFKALRVFFTASRLVAKPGDKLMLPLTVSNMGDEPETVTFSVTKPYDWSARILSQVGTLTSVNLYGGASLNLQLEVDIPKEASGSADLTLTATGKTNSTLEFTITLETEDVDFTETRIMCSEPWQVVYAGSSVVFNLNITNNVREDFYLLYIDNPPLPQGNWTASFYSNMKQVKSIGLEKHQSSLITLQVQVPEDAAAGDYSFRVYASGGYSITSIVLTVTVQGVSRKIDLVCPFLSKTAMVSQAISYPVKVVNDGEQDEKIFLGVNRTTDMMVWDISFSKNELTLEPKGSEWVTLNVKSPGITEAGIYSINITASTEDGKVKKVIPIIIELIADYLIEITDIQPINPQVASGEKIEIVVTVRNLGQSLVSRVRLKVNSTAISNIYTYPVDVLALEPLADAKFFISLLPETRLTPGGYLIEVQAISAETQSSVRGFIVSVVSPIPWFWISISLAIIATAVTVIMIQRLFSKYGIKFRLGR